jgi:predicted dehydrogenase/threonine dehydrogenase-like Zn-dependent dehydrogenase
MKQVVLNKSGEVLLVDVPAPRARPGFVHVRTRYSLISAGTEGAQLRQGQAGLLEKARQNPEQVKQMLNKLRREGVRSTITQVQDKLGEWRSVGYSLCGDVIAVGEGVGDLAPGDRVACAGAGYAVHAEEVEVPRNLVAKVPAPVDPRHAAFVTLGAIALHGVRKAQPVLGETALVIGLGLVGQLAAQFLRISGAKVAVSDLDPRRTETARDLGAEMALSPEQDAAEELASWTGGWGVDLVLIAAATSSSEPVRAAARLLRDRGRLVVVGEVGLELERGPFYMKELEFSISRSYGPGRYDPAYEEGGVDYPVAYVRWTEGRNLESVIDCIAREKLVVEPLITEEVELDDAPSVLRRIAEGAGGMGTLIRYAQTPPQPRLISLKAPPVTGKVGVLAVGAGWFLRTHRLPTLSRSAHLRLAGVVSANGASARQLSEKHGGSFAGTDLEEALRRSEVAVVLIGTRHRLHVPQALAAIRADKHVLIEKPLAVDADGLRALAAALREHPVRVAVGFNRRHAPLARELHRLLSERKGPLHGTYRINAGRLPPEHWINDPEEGGRIVGEACHAFDLVNFLVGADPVAVHAMSLRSADRTVHDDDNLSATVRYADGSLFTVLYSTAGPEKFPKEQVEVLAPGFAATLVDFRDLSWAGIRRGQRTLRMPDKGFAEELEAWAAFLRGEPSAAVDFSAGALSTWLTLRAVESARSGATLEVAATLSDLLGA